MTQRQIERESLLEAVALEAIDIHSAHAHASEHDFYMCREQYCEAGAAASHQVEELAEKNGFEIGEVERMVNFLLNEDDNPF